MNDSEDVPSQGATADPVGSGDTVDARLGFGKGSSSYSVAGRVSSSTSLEARKVASAVPEEEYNMTYPKRGYALIMNNRKFYAHTRMGERNGTDRDAANLYQTFQMLGFEVVRKDNLTVQEMLNAAYDYGAKDHSQNDCFACAILSHGEENVVYGVDGTLKIEEITNPFKGNNCKSLVGKPKIFLVQACRGTLLDHGADKADAGMEVDTPIERIPTEADFLMGYSVVPGYFSWRNSTRGSWFVQAICDVFDQYAEQLDKYDMLKLMTRVSKKVAYDFESNAAQSYMNKKKQVPCITSMLTKDLYFRPKTN